MFDAYLPMLASHPLFVGSSHEEIASLLTCAQAHIRFFSKNEYILNEGVVLRDLCLLLRGTVLIRRDDYWGNRTILRHVHAGELFAQAYAAPDSEPFPWDAAAISECTVMFIPFRKLLERCENSCACHNRIIRNLFVILCEENRTLTAKLGHMAQRTTREKLLSYLSDESLRAGSPSFEIPFNRQQLADYLSLDRSAMSEELGKMQREGLLTTTRSHFTLRTAFPLSRPDGKDT